MGGIAEGTAEVEAEAEVLTGIEAMRIDLIGIIGGMMTETIMKAIEGNTGA